MTGSWNIFHSAADAVPPGKPDPQPSTDSIISAGAGPTPGTGGWKRGLAWLLQGLGWIFLAGWTVWGTLAIFYTARPAALRPVLALGFVTIVGIAAFKEKRRPQRFIVLAGLFGVVLVWFFSLRPSNNRNWQPDVAVLPHAEIEGNQVTLHNIRNCQYRSETDYTVRYYDKVLDLSQLQTVDLYTVYWGSTLICHTMLSFGFGGDTYVCISIETRKEQGEAYSAIKGFFRQYELTYVVADERDLVRLRTNFRHEQAYLYRLRTEPAVARQVFLDYLKTVNSLRDQPEWYNALTSNCTSNIRGHTKPYARRSRWNWRLLVNGYVSELAYQNGALDQALPFAELRQKSLINSRAEAAGDNRRFSELIRAGLPGF